MFGKLAEANLFTLDSLLNFFSELFLLSSLSSIAILVLSAFVIVSPLLGKISSLFFLLFFSFFGFSSFFDFDDFLLFMLIFYIINKFSFRYFFLVKNLDSNFLNCSLAISNLKTSL